MDIICSQLKINNRFYLMYRPNLIYLMSLVTFRRQIHSKIMLLSRPTQPMHLFAIITKHSVIKHVYVQRTLLCVFFKLSGQSKVATLVSSEPTETRHDYEEATLPTLSPSRLLYVADKQNKCTNLIDTGAAVSVLA